MWNRIFNEATDENGSKIKILTTCTKASPTRCNGSHTSNLHRNSSKNCWWIFKMVGTIRNISSTIWLSIIDAFSWDFNGFKYFCFAEPLKWFRFRRGRIDSLFYYYGYCYFYGVLDLVKSIFAYYIGVNDLRPLNIKTRKTTLHLHLQPFPMIRRTISPYWRAQQQHEFSYPVRGMAMEILMEKKAKSKFKYIWMNGETIFVMSLSHDWVVCLGANSHWKISRTN